MGRAKSKKEDIKKVSLATSSEANASKFRIGDSVVKLAPMSDDYGLVGIIRSKEVSPDGYHFAWVMWQILKPEHYDCIKKVSKNAI
jgi:hypothetical protein